MIQFRSLRTKFAIIYATLFGLVLAAVAATAFFTVQRAATGIVRDEMATTGLVFDRILGLYSQRLEDATDLLARDFGFRAAVATNDAPTVESALANLQERYEFDLAFVLDERAGIVGLGSGDVPVGVQGFDAVLGDRDSAGGMMLVGGEPYFAVVRPVRAPMRVGRVVFAYRLGAPALRGMTELSAIPLSTQLAWHEDAEGWRGAQGTIERYEALLGEDGMADGPAANGTSADGEALISVIPLQALSEGERWALLLEYPLALAMAPYRAILAAIAVAGAIGMLVLVAGTWLLARSLTRPIKALEEAAGRLAEGGTTEVVVEGRDEIARLAESFNLMGQQISARERRITHLARHDVETGIPNLHALEHTLEAVEAARGEAHVAAIGIDRFHQVRGAIGYSASARMIAQLAERLRDGVPGVFVGRISTDTLGAVFTAQDEREAQRVTGQLGELAEQPVLLGAERVDVHATIGLAERHDGDGTDLTLIECAGVAVDQAREAGTRLARFDRAAYGDPTAGLSLMGDLVAALETGEIFLAYQPKFDIAAGRVAGAEALIRWQSESRGFIGPDDFIPMAEETGHIAPLTVWVLDRAIRDQAALAKVGHDWPVAINVSGRLISDAGFIRDAVRRVQAAGAKLVFEITETAVIGNAEAALENIAILRDAGIAIAIDDYGSGLSSLAYLQAIPAQELKIDKAFVLELDASGDDRLLVKSTIDLAHSLGMKVTAEGVENAAALATLATMGADIAQGYHIARPMPLADLAEFLASGSGGLAGSG